MVPARFALNRPVTVVMVFVSMIAIGLVAGRLLPLEYFPAVDIPFIGIEVPYQGSTPENTRPMAIIDTKIMMIVTGRLIANWAGDMINPPA